MGSTARRSAAGPTSGSSCSSRSAQASSTDRTVRKDYCERVNDTQQLSQLESMGERQLPGGQEYSLLPRVRELPRERRSLGAKVAARERGALSGPRSLPERARIAEVARDAEASETCKRLCVLPEGLARRRRKLSLRGRLCIAVWITGRGVSRHGSPGDQSVRVLLTCRNVETDWIRRGMQEVCRMLDSAARRMKRGHKNKDPEIGFWSREKTLPCRSKQVCCRRRREECDGLDFILLFRR